MANYLPIKDELPRVFALGPEVCVVGIEVMVVFRLEHAREDLTTHALVRRLAVVHRLLALGKSAKRSTY